MRETGPIFKKVPRGGEKYISVARTFLGKVKERKERLGLLQAQDTFELADGTKIFVQILPDGKELVRIEIKEEEKEEEEEKEYNSYFVAAIYDGQYGPYAYYDTFVWFVDKGKIRGVSANQLRYGINYWVGDRGEVISIWEVPRGPRYEPPHIGQNIQGTFTNKYFLDVGYIYGNHDPNTEVIFRKDRSAIVNAGGRLLGVGLFGDYLLAAQYDGPSNEFRILGIPYNRNMPIDVLDGGTMTVLWSTTLPTHVDQLYGICARFSSNGKRLAYAWGEEGNDYILSTGLGSVSIKRDGDSWVFEHNILDEAATPVGGNYSNARLFYAVDFYPKSEDIQVILQVYSGFASGHCTGTEYPHTYTLHKDATGSYQWQIGSWEDSGHIQIKRIYISEWALSYSYDFDAITDKCSASYYDQGTYTDLLYTDLAFDCLILSEGQYTSTNSIPDGRPGHSSSSSKGYIKGSKTVTLWSGSGEGTGPSLTCENHRCTGFKPIPGLWYENFNRNYSRLCGGFGKEFLFVDPNFYPDRSVIVMDDKIANAKEVMEGIEGLPNFWLFTPSRVEFFPELFVNAE